MLLVGNDKGLSIAGKSLCELHELMLISEPMSNFWIRQVYPKLLGVNPVAKRRALATSEADMLHIYFLGTNAASDTHSSLLYPLLNLSYLFQTRLKTF